MAKEKKGVRLEHISKIYQDPKTKKNFYAVKDTTLDIEPGVLLFDEPLSNLDAKLRVSMRTEIRRIQQEAGITAVYVTHDQSEAMAISDKVIIMENGVVAQMGTPQEIYYHPKSEFVADFNPKNKKIYNVGDRAYVAFDPENVHVL